MPHILGGRWPNDVDGFCLFSTTTVEFQRGWITVAKQPKAKGFVGQKSARRNNGIPGCVRRLGSSLMVNSSFGMISGAGSLFEMARRAKMLRRWGVKFGNFTVFGTP
jgi:hypothetical protein